MGIIKTAGNLFGFLLLGMAGLAAIYGVVMVASIFLWGPTNERVGGLVLAMPTVMTAGVFGVFVRKAIAGTVLPIDYDVADAYRSFIGGGG